MRIVHLEMAEAKALVAAIHRHRKPVRGYRFAIGAEHRGVLVGAAILGRPVARQTDQRNTVEVTRLVTDGTPNACSFLDGAAARIARELGYHRIQTFILESEPGTSLLAAGWTFDGTTAAADGPAVAAPTAARISLPVPRNAMSRYSQSRLLNAYPASPNESKIGFKSGQAVADQSGPGVRSFTFGEPMDLIVVPCFGRDGRADPFGGNPDVTGNLGILCESAVPTYVPIHTATIKLDLSDGMSGRTDP